MAARALLNGIVRDPEGRPVQGVSVYIYDPGTTDEIAATMYEEDDPGVDTLSNPLTTGSDGSFAAYVVTEQRVTVHPVKTGYTFQDREADFLNVNAADVTYATTAEIANVGAVESAGTSDTVARGDHVHAGGVTSHNDLDDLEDDDHPQYVKDSEFTADHDILMGTGAGTFTPIQPATTEIANIADAEAAGTSDTWARGDHVHRRASFVGARAFAAGTQSIPTASPTALAFASESYDTNTFHDTTTNNSRMTIPSGFDGKYLVVGQVRYTANATGHRDAQVYKNGAIAAITRRGVVDGTDDEIVQVSLIVEAVATDYFQLMAEQSSGSNLNTASGAAAGTWFSIQYLGA